MLQFSCLYHQNTESSSSTIILLTYATKILAYWMLHCCFCVEWWYAKPPKTLCLSCSGTVVLHSIWIKKMFTFCVSSDCGSFKWLQEQLQSEKFWDTFSSSDALMYLLQEKNVEMHHKNYNFLLLPLSPVSSQSLLTESVASSQPDSTAVDKTVPETEELQGWCLIFSDRTY